MARANATETLAYGWDAAARLTGVAKNGATQATFAYDGDGNRRSKTGGGQATTYVNDARGLARVLQATTGATTTTYVAGIAQYDPSQAGEAERWGYTVSDAQNARLLLDGSGVVARRWEWEPFGTARAEGGTTPARFGYGGEERDDETGLVNLRARYYDPALGRFLSRDTLPGAPTNAQGWNRYAYVENDPINHLDPSGHRKIKYENGQDPDDDDRARKRAQSCRNPGRYTGSCPGGPPDPAYAAEGEAGDAAKRAGRAASAGNLAAAAAWAQSASHFASIAGTAAAQTAAIQAWASVWAAMQAMQAARPVDHAGGGNLHAMQVGSPTVICSTGFSVALCASGPQPVPGITTETNANDNEDGIPLIPPIGPIGPDDNDENFVYRSLAPGEPATVMAGLGVVRTQPWMATALEQHVLGAPSTHSRNPWVSTTRSLEVARKLADRDDAAHVIIKVDLRKVTYEYVDVSDPVRARLHLRSPRAVSYATSQQEVSIRGGINPEAIVLIGR